MDAKRISCGVLGAWMLMTTFSQAQSNNLSHAFQISKISVGQSPTTGSRREADELLRRSRGAMKDGNLAQARWYLERAEKMDVKYDGLLKRFIDTPEKVRRDLAKLDPANTSSARKTDSSDVDGAVKPETVKPETVKPETVDNQLASKPLPLNADAQPSPNRSTEFIKNPYTNPKVGAQPPQPAVPAPLKASPWTAKKQQASQLLSSARASLSRGDIAFAETQAQRAHAMRIPDAEFGPGEARPWMVLLEVDKAKRQMQSSAVVPAGGVIDNGGVRQAVVGIPDGSRVRPAASEPSQLSNTRPLPGEPNPFNFPLNADRAPAARVAQFESTVQATPDRSPAATPAMKLIREGEAAVKNRDFTTARDRFRAAWKYEAELDPQIRQRLQDNLQLSRAAGAESVPPPSPLSTGEQAMVRRFSSEIAREQVVINRQLRNSPRAAWEQLKTLRAKVSDAEIPEDARRQLLGRVDRSIDEAEKYIEQNRARIELDEDNKAVLAEVDRRRLHQIQVDDELTRMVDEFNKLMDQERFSEAVVIAKQARELHPEDPTVESMAWKSRFAERLMVDMSLRSRSEEGVIGALMSVSQAGIPFDDRNPIEFPQDGNAKYWEDLTDRRRRAMSEGSRRLSDTELEIQRALRKKVQVDFSEQPLGEVLTHLGDLVGISIYIDPQGLTAEGASSDMPVTIRLNQEVQLKSALNIILEQFSLSYVIQDEVLKITSETIRASKVYVDTYDVADLVIPIPNFLPSYNVGLPSAIREAYNAQGFGNSTGGYNQVPLTIMANNQNSASASNSVLAQMSASGALSNTGGSPQPIGFGPGGLGGGAQADFDTLIELITATIAPTTWDEVGGEGSIQGFPTNLSLVVSQTQEVHQQIADLLEQLRRLQDLQVTIEVRFITLNDNFFERIGVDFDFDIDDNTTVVPNDDSGPSIVIGLDPQGNPTADLDLQFSQGSFGEAVPAFGGFSAGSAATFGFAIISDIEAFFLIEAAQGDQRTNVLQAPKVTLFNGQQASVNDSNQRPFVTSVTPVVGDFAAAQAPIIVVLSEGTSLNVQAVVSNDRRFVRLTLVPFFSKIGDVEEFTFEGRRVSNTGTAVADPTDPDQTLDDNAEEIIEGTTVQLPQFAFTSVSTTVSVPDGGTILLGGIKRLQEGRNEQGVPVLSKFPYINRLFKNVGIGRTTQSLMMMVTPRIIIQEEEESKLGIALPGN
ncbi:MAG: general secretion pathway protein GspD [Pirellulaceae bacterium]|nr:general secretion pathway protein GspD [Pirellulaceae bacterium]